MLIGYSAALDNFKRLNDTVNEKLSYKESIDNYTRGRLYDTALDIINLQSVFSQTHTELTESLTNDTNNLLFSLTKGQEALEQLIRTNPPWGNHRTQSAQKQIKALYKAYFYFIRAFQDSAYAVLLSLSDRNAGVHSSINDCIKKKSAPVYPIIEGIDGYIEWFVAFKKMRDQIKQGINFGICGPQNDPGITFTYRDAQKNESRSGRNFRIIDLITAINFSSELLAKIETTPSTSVKKPF